MQPLACINLGAVKARRQWPALTFYSLQVLLVDGHPIVLVNSKANICAHAFLI